MSTSDQSEQSSRLAAFGPNEWLVDEIYQQYLSDRTSVDPAWWDFFADYVPTEHAGADLVAASAAVRAGARLLATNDDATYPTPSGPIPGCGSLLAAVEVAAGDRKSVV